LFVYLFVYVCTFVRWFELFILYMFKYMHANHLRILEV